MAHGKSSSLRAARHGERATAAWSGYRRLNQDEFDCYEGYLLGCYGTVELWDRGDFAGERDGRFFLGNGTEVAEDSTVPVLYYCGDEGWSKEYTLCITRARDFDSKNTCLMPKNDDYNTARCSGVNVFHATRGDTGGGNLRRFPHFTVDIFREAVSALSMCARWRSGDADEASEDWASNPEKNAFLTRTPTTKNKYSGGVGRQLTELTIQKVFNKIECVRGV